MLQLNDAMMTALKGNRPEFVKLFLENSNNLPNFFDQLNNLWNLYENVSFARPELRRLLRQMSFSFIIFVVIKQNNSKSCTYTAELALHVLFSPSICV